MISSNFFRVVLHTFKSNFALGTIQILRNHLTVYQYIEIVQKLGYVIFEWSLNIQNNPPKLGLIYKIDTTRDSKYLVTLVKTYHEFIDTIL